MSFFRTFLHDLSATQRLFAYVVTVALIAVLFVFLSSDDPVSKLAIALFCFAALFFTTVVVIPKEERRQRTVRYATWAFLTLSLSALCGPWWVPLAVQQLPLDESSKQLLSRAGFEHSVVVLLIFFLAYVALLFLQRDRSALGRVDTPIDDEFQDLNFRQRLHIFCEELVSDLQGVERDLRWNVSHFVPLDAEVELVSGHRRSRKVWNLLRALREIRTTPVNLVLGVPGSGKSVALRKLCTDLMAETKDTGRIPVYVNLKEWLSNRVWSLDSPPTEAEFRTFVFTNVRARLADQSQPFFDEYFDRLIGTGRIFFVLDSFDEIPGILDANESSELLTKLSDMLVKFLKSGFQSRGIIASRYYRRPAILGDRGVLEIRPFSELQIGHAIKNASAASTEITKALFDDRPDFGAAARNPFVLSLILKYVSKHKKLPDKQAELFADYITDSLELADENAQTLGLAQAVLRTAMQEIAWMMFESERFGLEMPVAELRRRLPDYPIDDIVAVLQGARLVRVGAPNRTLSFVHRRFNEYFLVHRFVEQPELAPLDAIPQDSRWRDAMVLFAEVASDEVAETIAVACWQEVKGLTEATAFEQREQYLRGLHSLRFLVEAFRGRRVALKGFQEALGERILAFVNDNHDLVSNKHAVEAIGLLGHGYAQQVLVAALKKSNEWISETALRACRYLTKLEPESETLLTSYIHSIPPFSLVRRNRELSFSLQTAEVFSTVANTFRFYRGEVFVRLTSAIVFTVSAPSYVVVMVPLWVMVIGMILLPLSIPLPKVTVIGKNSVVAVTSTVPDFGVYGRLWNSEGFLFAYMLAGTSYLITTISPASPNEGLIDLAPLMVSKTPVSILLIACVLLLPWSRVYARVRKIDFKELVTVMIVASVFGVCMFLLSALFEVLPDWFLVLLPMPLGLFVFTLLGWGAVFLIKNRLFDRKTLRQSTRVFAPDRDIIGRHFMALRTPRGRFRYARWVETNASDHLDALADPKNGWPNSKRPNVNNDAGSTLLAQLDARWLKLDI